MSERQYNLKDDGVKMVEYPPALEKSVERAAKLWQVFCKLPPQVKQQLETNDNQWGVGYERKDGAEPHGDIKENFDYSRRGAQELEQVLEHVNNESVREFVAAAQALTEQAVPMIEAFGQEVETEYGVGGFGDLAKQSAPNAFFRFLHYPRGQSMSALIAEPHVDHSGFTFHLFETTTGCERLTFDGTWESLPVDEGQAAAFASMQTQLVSRGEIKGLAHRVVANETSARVGRYAIVCFVALVDTPKYDKKTHGRLQEKSPGFNYTMSFGEFSGLFK